MKKSIFLSILILVAAMLLSNIAAAQPPLRDPVISGKLAEAQMLLDDCVRMGKLSRRATAEIQSRINLYRERSLNTEIRHGGMIPPPESMRMNQRLDALIGEIAGLRNAPPPLPPRPVPPPPPPFP
ncbi:MAG: hypothetical protein HQL01_04840 [Nitrospirae bacterium]|nr:hypothetical protein [Nitrospirota bacterium]